MKALLRIHGRVQGVCYRVWTMEEARRRGLKGWVRNHQDGTVEVLLAGVKDKITDMIAACRLGPSAANVVEIEVKLVNVEIGDAFETRPSVQHAP